MYFGEWLKGQRYRQTPVGDLARACARDIKAGCLADWPKTPWRWEQHLAHAHKGQQTQPQEALAQAEHDWRATLPSVTEAEMGAGW